MISIAVGVLMVIGGVLTCAPSKEAPSLPLPAQEAADEPAAEQPQEPVRVFAADDLSNLAPDAPDIPVYDKHTLAERRAAGLPTALPDITPYRTGKTVYLTFDDGPDDKNTPAVLDILRDAGVKATFFVTGRQAEAHPDVLRRIYDEGHAIGNHSYDHRYEKLYPDVNGFLAEMERTDEIIYGILGVRPLILRAPGGTIGHFTAAYAPAIRANGYVEHDWNVSSADAAPGHPVAQDFIDNISSETDQEVAARTAIILMHSSEGHEETVKALPKIIELLKAKGYTFGVITPMTPQPW
ncbi:polysaccharide deacetylase family protein [uncultured Selenomonas sp.]|uniref:polysaccharide deacetylase family protein n=1 Tax=uncultured Selenomonas sp. TaxID=159275 RepID=UPI0025E2842C|nr:polysaccharide deacetylase family protein [uncultured Selenomonas sp.]